MDTDVEMDMDMEMDINTNFGFLCLKNVPDGPSDPGTVFVRASPLIFSRTSIIWCCPIFPQARFPYHEAGLIRSAL